MAAMLPSQNGQILSKLQFISYYSQTKNTESYTAAVVLTHKAERTSEIASYLNWSEHKGDFNENS